MVNVVNHTGESKPVNLTPGMFFKCNRTEEVYTLISVNGGWYLVNIANGYEWDGSDLEGLTINQVEDAEKMTWMNVKQVTFE